MENQLVTGVASGRFDILHFLRGGTLQELNTVLDNLSIGAGGGTTFTPSAPLSLSGGVLSINLSSYATTLALNNALAAYTDTTGLTALLASKISTTHEANHLGLAAVDHSGFDLTTGTLTLQTPQGVRVWIDADNGGNLSISSQSYAGAGIVTLPVMKAHISNSVYAATNCGITSLGNPSTGVVIFNVDTSILTTRSQTTADVSAAIAYFQSLTLRHNNDVSTEKALTQNATGKLLWDGGAVQMAVDTITSFNWVLPMQLTRQAQSLTIESLWLPSTVTAHPGLLATANDPAGTLQLYIDPVFLSTLFTTPAAVALTLQSYSTIAVLNFQLSFKQNTLTATLPLQLTGSTLSTLWKPSNLTVGAGLFALSSNNLGTVSLALTGTEERAELKLVDSNGAVTSLSRNVSGGLMWGLQDVSGELNKVTDMVDGPSGISTGDSAPATSSKHRIAAYESLSLGGRYYYGIGLIENANTAGLGLWGGTLNALPEQATGTGRLPDILITPLGRVGIGDQNPAQALCVQGSCTISGSLTAATKSFLIDHPDPIKAEQGMKLRHWVTESDEVGGSLLYRRQVKAIQGNNILEMPEFFKHLASHVMCVASPVRHFGLCWADLDFEDANRVVLGTSKAGLYTVLVTARRKDHCALHMCPQEVEFIPVPPEEGAPAFPSDAGTPNFPT